MNLLEIYNLLSTNEITTEQAASALGMTTKSLKFCVSRHKHRLPLILSVLDKIKGDKITREEAAKVLHRSTRQINKLMESWNVVRPIGLHARSVADQVSQIKWEILKKNAIDFISGSMDFETAAESANCHTRSMRRWVSKLLLKHYDMPYKDLGTLSMNRRRRLADEIETAEHLELSKQNVLKSIADGKLSIQEEALNRVLSRRSNQDRRNSNA